MLRYLNKYFSVNAAFNLVHNEEGQVHDGIPVCAPVLLLNDIN